MSWLNRIINRLAIWALSRDEDFKRMYEIVNHKNFATHITKEEKQELENHLKTIFEEYGLDPERLRVKRNDK